MFVFLLFIFTLINPLSAGAKVSTEKANIAAVVNQHAITERELDCRLDFAIATLNMPKTKESRDSMRHTVLQNLIVEKLQSATAAEAGIKISENDLKTALDNLAQDNGMTLDQLRLKFKEMGIKVDTLKERMRAQILWARFIRAMFGRQVKITDSDVEKEQSKLRKNIESDQYELIEIILPVDQKNPAKTKVDADKLYQQVCKPMTNFRLVAQQFGAQSGYAGWKTEKQMDPEILNNVKTSNVGSVTKPIMVRDSYKIVKLVDKKTAGHGSFRSRKISVAKLNIRLPDEMNEENIAILENITQHVKNSKNCQEFKKTGADANGHSEISEEKPLSSFPEPLQVILDNVAPNQVVGPVQDGQDVSFLMICSVKHPEKEVEPSVKEIKMMLEQKAFASHSTRFLNKMMAVARIAVTGKHTQD